MVRIQRETGACNAHHPREDGISTRTPGAILKLAYEVWRPENHQPSDEKINLIFVHGAMTMKEMWRYHVEKLYERLGDKLGICITYDVVNQGESYLLNEAELTVRSSWADGGRDVIEAMKHFNERGRNILIGHSMGGAQVHYAAFFEPAIVDSLVTLDPIIYSPPGPDDIPLGVSGSLSIVERVRPYVREEFKDEKSMLAYVTKASGARRYHPRIQKDYIDHWFRPRKSPDDPFITKIPLAFQLACYLNSTETFRIGRHLVAATPFPVLHIVGNIHDFNGEIVIDGYHKCLRKPYKAVVSGAGHNFPYEKPDATIDALVKFINMRYDTDVTEYPLSPNEGLEEMITEARTQKFKYYTKL